MHAVMAGKARRNRKCMRVIEGGWLEEGCVVTIDAEIVSQEMCRCLALGRGAIVAGEAIL